MMKLLSAPKSLKKLKIFRSIEDAEIVLLNTAKLCANSLNLSITKILTYQNSRLQPFYHYML